MFTPKQCIILLRAFPFIGHTPWTEPRTSGMIQFPVKSVTGKPIFRLIFQNLVLTILLARKNMIIMSYLLLEPHRE